RGDIEIAVVADQQTLIGIERIAVDRRREITWAGNVADVRLEILDFIENGGVIQETLLSAVVRIESRIERHALARAGIELPDDSIGEALEMATGAALPAFTGKAISQRVGAWNIIEIAARREKDLRP